jgi:hypothetical protein
MRRSRKLGLIPAAVLTALALAMAGASAFGPGDATDPARNIALPCEAVSTQGGASRAARDIVYVANVCGIVGTDVELQSRKDATGRVHDYAFLGTMGAGPRIFDVTDPVHPRSAGGYADSGWENDIQVRGNLMLATFDGVNGEDSSASSCLKQRYPAALGQGVDIYRLVFDPYTATFDVQLLTCVANPPGGAHNASLSPDGKWLAISNCCSDWAIDVVDLRNVGAGAAVLRYRLIDESRAGTSASTGDARCPADAGFTCVVMKKPDGSSAAGLWRPHDVHFSRSSDTAYIAAINSTWIVDVSKVLVGVVRPIAVIPNIHHGGTLDDPHNIEISHQADVTKDGKILVVSDERGGGLTNTGCNTDPSGVIGGLHFFALAPIDGQPQTAGASPSNPVNLGDYFNPNPMMAADPLQPALDLRRLERACTAHVFRLGGNGSTSAGPIQSGYDGVSRLGKRQLSEAWYGAGVWLIDFSGPPSNADGVREDPRTTWGNTLGWNVMAGADTWSAKEYKGAIFAGDMVRGFDVYRPADCTALGCTAPLGLTFELDPADALLVDPFTGALG